MDLIFLDALLLALRSCLILENAKRHRKTAFPGENSSCVQLAIRHGLLLSSCSSYHLRLSFLLFRWFLCLLIPS